MFKSRASHLAALGVGLTALSLTATAQAGGRYRTRGYDRCGSYYSGGFGVGFYSGGGGFYISGGRYDEGCDYGYSYYPSRSYTYRSRGCDDGYRTYRGGGFYINTPRFRAGGFRSRGFSYGGFSGRHYGGRAYRGDGYRSGGHRSHRGGHRGRRH